MMAGHGVGLEMDNMLDHNTWVKLDDTELWFIASALQEDFGLHHSPYIVWMDY
jgi:hypothetical protein